MSHRKKLLAVVVVLAVALSLAAAPGVVNSAQDFYNRIEILGRMFEIVEMNYVEDVDADTIFEYAIDGVLDNLDPHSRYYTAEEYRDLTERYRGDYHGIGIQFDIFEGVLTVLDVLEGGPSEKLGLRPGDQIVAIEGDNAVGLDNDGVYERLRGPKGSPVDVTIRRPGLDEELEVTIIRDQVEISAVPTSTILEGDVGYVRLQTFSRRGADQLEERLREFEEHGISGLILDLRGNRGGLMNQAIRITDKFIDGGRKIVYTKGRIPNANGESYSTDRDTYQQVPMIVLVDHQSASASEIVAGALQDWDRALLVGQLTWGKALVQNQFPFRDGSALFLTIARYYTPSGRLIQRPYEGGDDDRYLSPDWEELEAGTMPETPEDDPASLGGAEAPEIQEEKRPIFHTAAGRTVLGGGGIAPDVIVEPTRVNSLAVGLYQRRLGFQFASGWATEHAGELPDDLGTYVEEFEITDEIFSEWLEFLERPSVQELFDEADVTLDEEMIEAAREDMSMYLKADIASNLWGLEAGRIILLGHDLQIDEARGLMPRAAALLELEPNLAGADEVLPGPGPERR